MAGQTITAVIAADARPFKKGMTQAAQNTSILTSSLQRMSAIGATAFLTLGAASAAFVGQSIIAADQSRQISKGLETAVKNSKAFGSSAANISKVTDALDAASAKLGELTGIDDEVISGLKRNWLAVPRIAATGIKGINKLALVAANVAAGTGKDLEAVASAFTKAYGDPKGAIAKLQKAGVVLNDQEKERYNQLIKNGKETEALGFLADTLNKKFAGAAQAAASPIERLKVSFGNFQENVGAAFLPIIDKYLPQIQTGLKDLATDPQFQADLDKAATTMGDIAKLISDTGKTLSEWKIPQGILTYIDWAINNLPNIYNIINFIATGKWGVGVPAATPASFPTINTNSKGQVVNINVNAVSSSAETGKAVANALATYYRSGGKQVK